MNVIERLHSRYISDRRARVLSEQMAPLFPLASRVLDIGSGDGQIAMLIKQIRPDVQTTAVDVLLRSDTRIPVQLYNGRSLPFEEGSFDMCMLVDVLHHAQEPLMLLGEARRVCRRAIVIKDHALEGVFARETLGFMDQVGNRRHGVALPHIYWSLAEWMEAFESLELSVESWSQRVPLYPWPLSFWFGRSLHFIAKLGISIES